MLNPWQKISRVLPGLPFGNGADGLLTVAVSQTQSQTRRSCSGMVGSTTLNLTLAGFANGDVVLIHQSRGSGVGQWEINRVSSGGGTATLTLQKILQFTYTDLGASQAQVIKLPMHTDIMINAGVTLTAPGWDGDTGGFIVLVAKNQLSIAGILDSKGNGGTATANTEPGAGGGYLGGISRTGSNQQAGRGEGINGARDAGSTAAEGNAGGGGFSGDGIAGGGGGGHGTAGSDGGDQASLTVRGKGGFVAGSADLVTLVFGGAGGGGASNGDPDAGSGANGGGGIVAIAKTINVTGSVNNNGGNAVNLGGADDTGGGGGAGGATLFVSQTATLGANLVIANFGTGGSGFRSGGPGGVGRIALHYSVSFTGTTNPALIATTDPSLKEAIGGAFILNFA